MSSPDLLWKGLLFPTTIQDARAITALCAASTTQFAPTIDRRLIDTRDHLGPTADTPYNMWTAMVPFQQAISTAQSPPLRWMAGLSCALWRRLEGFAMMVFNSTRMCTSIIRCRMSWMLPVLLQGTIPRSKTSPILWNGGHPNL